MADARSPAEQHSSPAASVMATTGQAANGAGRALGGLDWEVGVYRDHLVAALEGYPELQDRVRHLPAGGPYYTLQDVLEVLPPARDQPATAALSGSLSATPFEAIRSEEVHETPALTEEDLDLLPDTHSDAVAEDEVAPAVTEEDLDLQPETAEERRRGEPSPATDETAEDLGGGRSETAGAYGDAPRRSEEEVIMRQHSDEDRDSEGGVRRAVGNVTGRIENLGERVEGAVESGVRTSFERVAGRERAERVADQLDQLEDRAEETVEQAAERAQAAMSGVAGRVESTTARVSPVQRVLVLGFAVGVVSGLVRWTVRQVSGRDLAWLGPREVRPAVLGVGLAGAVASGFLPDQGDRGND